MRRKVTNRNIVGEDYKYNSAKVGKFINYVMLRGQKETARKIVYDALEEIKEKLKKHFIHLFEAEFAPKNTITVTID